MVVDLLDVLTGDGQEVVLLLELLVDAVIDLSNIVLIGSLLRMVHLRNSQPPPLRPLRLLPRKGLRIPSWPLQQLVILAQRALFGEGGICCFIEGVDLARGLPRWEVNVAIHKLLVGDLDLLEPVVGAAVHPSSFILLGL